MYNMSKESKYDQEYKRELIMDAYEIISKYVQDKPNRFEVQKWYALLLDAKSAYGGTKERIKQLETVKKHMDVSLFYLTQLNLQSRWLS